MAPSVGRVGEGTFQGQGKGKGASSHRGPIHWSTNGYILLMIYNRWCVKAVAFELWIWKYNCTVDRTYSLIGKGRRIKTFSRILSGKFLRGKRNGPFAWRIERLAESLGC